MFIPDLSSHKSPAKTPIVRESALRVGADPGFSEVSSKTRIRSRRARRQQGSDSCATVGIYHAAARRAPVPEGTRLLPCGVSNVSRVFSGFGLRPKRRRACSAVSTSAGGWEAPVRTRNIKCFGDWKTPQPLLHAVKHTAPQPAKKTITVIRRYAMPNARPTPESQI